MADTPITTGTTPLPLPVDSPNAPSATATATAAAARETSKKASELPPVTTGTSHKYIHRLASAVSRASSTDSLTVLFQSEKLPPGQSITDIDTPALQRIIYEASKERAIRKLGAPGAFIVEAANFAAAACWEPARVGGPHLTDERSLDQRPIFRGFGQDVSALMREHLYPLAERVSGGRYWKLSLMARDPAVEYVPGAVRVVLVPFIERFTSEQNEGGPMPVWIEAGSEHARAIYAHFGFREVGVIKVGDIKTWGMIYTGNIDTKGTDTDVK
ncbi:uncharacterized protein F4822DRAFT_267942 [Hypoxylon trugodes]|uniref:uncharacterized protein n=1 Tax=Hypoxylon trugodes TaxID=326681 RepID=UPI00219E6B4E|nr:uncharacterized protein F4822DRAFT_267942 [Hypoxylon trugodes]KAI1389044.1 hypothetical protein F4822DRAFT_267942 [Hypoxylon trugodes]